MLSESTSRKREGAGEGRVREREVVLEGDGAIRSAINSLLVLAAKLMLNVLFGFMPDCRSPMMFIFGGHCVIYVPDKGKGRGVTEGGVGSGSVGEWEVEVGQLSGKF